MKIAKLLLLFITVIAIIAINIAFLEELTDGQYSHAALIVFVISMVLPIIVVVYSIYSFITDKPKEKVVYRVKEDLLVTGGRKGWTIQAGTVEVDTRIDESGREWVVFSDGSELLLKYVASDSNFELTAQKVGK